jgi:hypothetical protein
MRIAIPAALLLAAALSACQALPPTALSEAPRHVLRYNGIAGTDLTLPVYLPDGNRLTPVSAEASDSYRGLGAARAIDGQPGTAWVSADPHAANASLTVTFPTHSEFRGMRIKTGPTPDATTFKVMASDDGVHWDPISGRLANLTWHMEPQEIGGSGKQLKVVFYNSLLDAHTRFWLFELEVYGRTRP